MESDALENFGDLILPNRREIVFQFAGQGLVLFLGKKELDKQLIDIDLTKAVELLEEDVPNFLTKEPHWEIFADDFRVVDNAARGNRVIVAGLLPIKGVSGTVRDFISDLPLQDAFKATAERVVNLNEAEGEREVAVIVQWGLTIKSPQDVDLPAFLDLKSAAFPLRLTGEFCFRFRNAKVSTMVCDLIQVNGNTIDFPTPVNPDLTVGDVESALGQLFQDAEDTISDVLSGIRERLGLSARTETKIPTYGNILSDDLDDGVRG
eukprot:CAMPEP_0169262430 /NCGR_PEP_ID=MMETSP1016-20121227/43705_1 /TAXON_ID=342587 /ORGANISM="Karlodinium micrum, Strain CCMP2283" /LENGTH=263 /DNA_ID=CAMNT_0009344959 /DNA_START=803 /DNA_END=1590 /DNA_ORIENTATION=-